MRHLFRALIPTSIVALVVCELTLIFLCYVAGSWAVSEFLNPNLSLTTFLFDEGGLIQIAVVVGCLVLGLYFQDLYSNVRVRSITLLEQQLCLVVGLAFFIQATFAYIRRPEWSLPRWAMIFGSILVLIVVPAWRVFFTRVMLAHVGSQRVLFLGTSAINREIVAHLANRPEIRMKVLGYIDDTDASTDLGEAIVGQMKDLGPLVDALKPDLVVVGMAERRKELPMPEMLRLRFSGIRFEEAAVTFEAVFGRVSTREMHPSRLVYSSFLGPRKGSLFWHSLYSIPIATLFLILSAPVMLIVAVVVRVTSRGPVFYRQERVGLNGVPFTVYKFRSMRVDAEAATGPVWAQRDDPRLTPPGRWLRRLRLDELPQVFNLFRNEMALVGPRPERPEFVKSLTEKIPYYNYRHCVKPGITGWAQINYKYGDTFEDAIMKLEYDLYYVKNLTVSLDLFIVLHTLKVMLFSGTAQ